MRHRTAAVVAIPLVFILLVALVPARSVIWFLQWQNWQITAEDTSGLWWRGQADGVVLEGLALGEVAWRRQLKPLLARHWQLEIDGREAHGAALLRSDGDTFVARDVAFELPAAWLNATGQLPLIGLGGRLRGDFTELAFSNGLPEAGEGSLQWEDASLGGLVNLSLGKLYLAADSVKGGVQLNVSTPDPVDMDITGLLRVVDGRYALDVSIGALAPSARRQLGQWLALPPPSSSEGQFRIQRTGRLEPPLVN